MWARLIRYAAPADRLDSFVEAFKARDTGDQGPADAFLLVDRDAGVAVSMSLWPSEEAMTEGGGAGEQSREQAIEAGSARVVDTETFEVAMQLRESAG